ncbi:MAG: RecQ family ATP-dependent DNA helicase [Bacteroidales bacterium]|jgi:ATP-dependent DNA helicase RecQ|nr:RecQ family ATP-dependent DNA helicase [Bacteroidales bacterium]
MNKYEQILTKYWGYSKFRPLQEDIIQSVMDNKDTLALMPTGGGKSITFQVPTMAKEGICIVITPLIALMKDQVENLTKRDIKAISIYSGMTKNEIDIALENCIYGNVKFLYISPERIATEIFRIRVKHMKVNLIAIDEAHCISEWGYDFRPSYLKIADIRDLIPNIPFLALTATAIPKVVDDIQDKLGFKVKTVFRKSFERKNIIYLVRELDDKTNYLIENINKVKGSGIIYVRNRKNTREIALLLQKNNISADYYHAGLNYEIRNKKQDEWKVGKIRVMVSTNAFGMGIDKADVRFVIHLEMPDSIESYFQEAGRGGRDEKKAVAVLLYNNSDKIKIQQRVIRNFPDIIDIKAVYQALGNYFQIPFGGGKFMSFDFAISDFAKNYNFNLIMIHSSIKILQREGYLVLTDELHSVSKVHFLVGRDDLYKFQIANAKFDGFVKLILRSYAGLFSDYVNIDENSLAKKANINIDVVFEYLNKLKSLGVLGYIPQKKNPFIVFTEERLDDKSLYISKENYEFRKNRYIERINAMLHYASSNNKCRSQILLNYFGDNKPERCGQCDVCTRRNELDLSKYEFDLILDRIKEKLLHNFVSMEELVSDNHKNKVKNIKVIQWLLDNNKIIKNHQDQLTWNIED